MVRRLRFWPPLVHRRWFSRPASVFRRSTFLLPSLFLSSPLALSLLFLSPRLSHPHARVCRNCPSSSSPLFCPRFGASFLSSHSASLAALTCATRSKCRRQHRSPFRRVDSWPRPPGHYDDSSCRLVRLRASQAAARSGSGTDRKVHTRAETASHHPPVRVHSRFVLLFSLVLHST